MSKKKKIEKQKHIVFCLPGYNFSYSFMFSWTNLLSYCFEKGYLVTVSLIQGSNIYTVRLQCVGGEEGKGVYRAPWNGDIDYTHIMWIDADMVFTPENFQALLDHDEDIISGAACLAGGKDYAFGLQSRDNGITITKDNLSTVVLPGRINKKGLLEVCHVGMAFILMKKGVLEKIKYPWFFELPYKNKEGVVCFNAEDFSFCVKARKAGFKLFIDLEQQIGHEKPHVWYMGQRIIKKDGKYVE